MSQLQEQLLEHKERVRLELLARTERMETTLSKEFRKWAISFESSFKSNDPLLVGFNERLVSVEERLGERENR